MWKATLQAAGMHELDKGAKVYDIFKVVVGAPGFDHIFAQLALVIAKLVEAALSEMQKGRRQSTNLDFSISANTPSGK